jgi:hypothetical protein
MGATQMCSNVFKRFQTNKLALTLLFVHRIGTDKHACGDWRAPGWSENVTLRGKHPRYSSRRRAYESWLKPTITAPSMTITGLVM